MTQPPDERGAELRELFYETSQELLQALNDEALKLEKQPGDEEIVRSIRRTVHTLKGDSAACGLRELSELAHQFEDALSLEGTAAHSAVADIAFAAADVFVEMIGAYRNGSKMPSTRSISKRIQELTAAPGAKKPRRTKKASGTTATPKATTKLVTEWTEYERLSMSKAQAAGVAVYHVIIKMDPHCAMPIAGRQLIQNALGSLGEVLAVRPDAKSPAAAKYAEFALATSHNVEQIAAKGRIPTIAEEVTIDLLLAPSTIPVSSTTPEPVETTASASTETAHSESEEPSRPSDPGSHAVQENVLRVEAGRIDNVLNLVGELIIGKSMLQQALNEFSKLHPKDPLRGRFADAMAFQSRVLNDLQRSVMKIRMVPVDQLFRRFPRVVRDVARSCGRDVELLVSGQDTDLDKGILDAIAEPLTHLVRNAVSHGIESPEERGKMGKAPQGTIRLNAYHQGNHVIVEVADDGRGIDSQKVRAKAVELGLATPEEAARLSESEILDFIFRPGFSTAEQITEISGRGVGMDVVQSVLHRLKASVSVDTQAGRGTTFRLKLPLTLAIIRALLFWVEHRLYAIPLNAVMEIARTVESEIHQVDNYEVLQLRNEVLPMLRLGRPAAVDRKVKLFVLVILVGERKYGLIVDALEGEEELVIKALDDQTFSTDLVSGASILGDGRVVLILNLPAVVEHVSRSRPEQAGQTASGLLLSYADRAALALAPAIGGRI
jgi:two-component system chemotaxis sensor kinase CheA